MGSNLFHPKNLARAQALDRAPSEQSAGLFFLPTGLRNYNSAGVRESATLSGLYEAIRRAVLQHFESFAAKKFFTRSAIQKEVTADEVIAYCQERGVI